MDRPLHPKDHAAEAARYRHHAEECRAKGELMADQETRAQYFRLAEGYDAMADCEEQLAHNLDIANRQTG